MTICFMDDISGHLQSLEITCHLYMYLNLEVPLQLYLTNTYAIIYVFTYNETYL